MAGANGVRTGRAPSTTRLPAFKRLYLRSSYFACFQALVPAFKVLHRVVYACSSFEKAAVAFRGQMFEVLRYCVLAEGAAGG